MHWDGLNSTASAREQLCISVHAELGLCKPYLPQRLLAMEFIVFDCAGFCSLCLSEIGYSWRNGANRLMLGLMIDLLRLLCGAVIELLRSSTRREAEILVLRHQLKVLKRQAPTSANAFDINNDAVPMPNNPVSISIDRRNGSLTMLNMQIQGGTVSAKSQVFLLQRVAHALGVGEGCAVTASYPEVRSDHRHANSFRTAPSLCADMIFGKDTGLELLARPGTPRKQPWDACAKNLPPMPDRAGATVSLFVSSARVVLRGMLNGKLTHAAQTAFISCS
jgi:hypothetical protein